MKTEIEEGKIESVIDSEGNDITGQVIGAKPSVLVNCAYIFEKKGKKDEKTEKK